MTYEPCGLNGCNNPTDPDSGIGRCRDCTLAWSVEFMRVIQNQRDAVTSRASVDALLIARTFIRGDEAATALLLKHADPWSCALQLAGWLRAAVSAALEHGAGREFGDTSVEHVLDRWIYQVRSEIGEAS